MTRPVRARFWMEVALSVVALVMAIVTVIAEDWIEQVFHVAPDGGSGELEKIIVVALVLVAVVSGFLARRESRRRLAPEGPAGE